MLYCKNAYKGITSYEADEAVASSLLAKKLNIILSYFNCFGAVLQSRSLRGLTRTHIPYINKVPVRCRACPSSLEVVGPVRAEAQFDEGETVNTYILNYLVTSLHLNQHTYFVQPNFAILLVWDHSEHRRDRIEGNFRGEKFSRISKHLQIIFFANTLISIG